MQPMERAANIMCAVHVLACLSERFDVSAESSDAPDMDP